MHNHDSAIAELVRLLCFLHHNSRQLDLELHMRWPSCSTGSNGSRDVLQALLGGLEPGPRKQRLLTLLSFRLETPRQHPASARPAMKALTYLYVHPDHQAAPLGWP